MRAFLTALALGGAAALIAACATPGQTDQTESGGGNQCFNADMVSGFSAPDDDTVYIAAGRNVFELEVIGSCPNIDFEQRIGIQSRGGTSFVCRGFDADLLVPSLSGTGVDRCPVRSVRRLTPAEVEALPAKDRP